MDRQREKQKWTEGLSHNVMTKKKKLKQKTLGKEKNSKTKAKTKNKQSNAKAEKAKKRKEKEKKLKKPHTTYLCLVGRHSYSERVLMIY